VKNRNKLTKEDAESIGAGRALLKGIHIVCRTTTSLKSSDFVNSVNSVKKSNPNHQLQNTVT
jgi:hypothetical protein